MPSNFTGRKFPSLRHFRRERTVPQVMIAPLIDIVFLLLIFFMLVTRFLSPSIAVALPDSSSGDFDDSLAVTVSVDDAGNIFFNETPVGLQELTSMLEESRTAGGIEIVRLRADKNTEWQVVVDVFDAIRASGILDIAIETGIPDNERAGD